MSQVILIHSMSGDDYHLAAGCLVAVTEAQKARWIELGVARELLSTEPTELQTMQAHSFLPKETVETQSEEVAEKPTQTPKRKQKNVPSA